MRWLWLSRFRLPVVEVVVLESFYLCCSYAYPTVSCSMPEQAHLEIDYDQELVYRVNNTDRESIVGLRPQEWQLIRYMDEHNRRNGYIPVLCTYEQLTQTIWGDKDFYDAKRDLIHLILELRRKIEVGQQTPQILVNVRSKGYRLITQPYLAIDELPPFVAGHHVRHPRHFFGRMKELRSIFSVWRPLAMQNVAVVGLKKSGKTSLLHYLKNIHFTPPAHLRSGQRSDWLDNAERYHFVFVNFRDDPRMRMPERLLRHILTSLNMPVPEPCSLITFLDVLEANLQAPTVILMDDIGAALASPHLDRSFWQGFRHLDTIITNGNLSFVLAAHEDLTRLSIDLGKESPFFNTFGHACKLGPLTEEEALALIACSPIPFDSDDVAWIMAQSRRWPAVLQSFCHVRLNALRSGQKGIIWREEVLQQAKRFAHLLRDS